jgi:hypothetical protein
LWGSHFFDENLRVDENQQEELNFELKERERRVG